MTSFMRTPAVRIAIVSSAKDIVQIIPCIPDVSQEEIQWDPHLYKPSFIPLGTSNVLERRSTKTGKYRIDDIESAGFLYKIKLTSSTVTHYFQAFWGLPGAVFGMSIVTNEVASFDLRNFS